MNANTTLDAETARVDPSTLSVLSTTRSSISVFDAQFRSAQRQVPKQEQQNYL
jgi:hypothetical protein